MRSIRSISPRQPGNDLRISAAPPQHFDVGTHRTSGLPTSCAIPASSPTLASFSVRTSCPERRGDSPSSG